MKILISTSSIRQNIINELIKNNFIVKLNPYKRTLTTKEFIELTKDVDGIIAGTENITKEALRLRPNIKVISRCGTGLDNLDTVACNELGIKFYNTPDACTVAVAEFTVALTLNLIKNILIMDSNLKAGNWSKLPGNMIESKNIGIIGFGKIGHQVAKLLSNFNVEIAYNDLKTQNCKYKYMNKHDLILWSDIVLLHVSNINSNCVIDKKELENFKKTAYLINTSRGICINEEALYQSLKRGDLAGAALDVFAEEPYCGKLRELNNVILTPHCASNTIESREKMEIEALNNLLKGFDYLL